MNGLCISIVGFLLLSQTGPVRDPNAARGAIQQDPELLLRATMDAAVAVLRDKTLDPGERDKRLNDIVTPVFDFPLMAKLSMGKEHWPKLSPRQQQRFTDLFVQRLKDTYRGKLGLYTDEKVVIKPAVAKDKKVQIHTELISKDKTLAVVYRLHLPDKAWRIYDVEIEGISIVMTYKSQFDEVLKKGTVEDLLRQLEKSADKPQDPNVPKS